MPSKSVTGRPSCSSTISTEIWSSSLGGGFACRITCDSAPAGGRIRGAATRAAEDSNPRERFAFFRAFAQCFWLLRRFELTPPTLRNGPARAAQCSRTLAPSRSATTSEPAGLASRRRFTPNCGAPTAGTMRTIALMSTAWLRRRALRRPCDRPDLDVHRAVRLPHPPTSAGTTTYRTEPQNPMNREMTMPASKRVAAVAVIGIGARFVRG
jgi:hypothetical protein